jgi:hypothetical protein
MSLHNMNKDTHRHIYHKNGGLYAQSFHRPVGIDTLTHTHTHTQRERGRERERRGRGEGERVFTIKWH